MGTRSKGITKNTVLGSLTRRAIPTQFEAVQAARLVFNQTQANREERRRAKREFRKYIKSLLKMDANLWTSDDQQLVTAYTIMHRNSLWGRNRLPL